MAEAEAEGAAEAPGAPPEGPAGPACTGAGAARSAAAADAPRPAALLAAPVARPGWRPSTAGVGSPAAPCLLYQGCPARTGTMCACRGQRLFSTASQLPALMPALRACRARQVAWVPAPADTLTDSQTVAARQRTQCLRRRLPEALAPSSPQHQGLRAPHDSAGRRARAGARSSCSMSCRRTWARARSGARCARAGAATTSPSSSRSCTPTRSATARARRCTRGPAACEPARTHPQPRRVAHLRGGAMRSCHAHGQ